MPAASATKRSPKALITLLTDFGHQDTYVGVMKGVIAGICPTARVIDLCHEITPYEIPEAGFALCQSFRYFPKGTIHVVVVDPGVGSERRAIAVEAFGQRFLGPDNGLFSMLFRQAAAAAKGKKKPYSVREITNPKFALETVSNTFHGRDVFAPAAAFLAAGAKFSALGPVVDNALRQDWDLPIRTGKRFWQACIFKADRFGNLITNLRCSDFPLHSGRFELQAGMEHIREIRPNYAAASPGELFLIAGSSGYWEISLNQGSAAKRLGLRSGSPLELAMLG
jgi:S-adenosylmethionine hydrolase